MGCLVFYGVYSRYDSDANALYDVLAGIKANALTHHDMKSVEVVGGTYLVFNANGEMPAALVSCWKDIWAYFSHPACSHKRTFLTDFEQYIAPDQVLVHIGIESA